MALVHCKQHQQKLRPWAILAYVSGFEAHKRNFLDFERRWIARKVALQRQSNSHFSIEKILDLGETIALEFNEDRRLCLKFVHTGTISTLREHAPTIQVYSSTESERGQSSDSELGNNDAELDFSSSASDRHYDTSESSDNYDYRDSDEEQSSDNSDSSVDGPYDDDDDSDYHDPN